MKSFNKLPLEVRLTVVHLAVAVLHLLLVGGALVMGSTH
jgi:hypothetical protein